MKKYTVGRDISTNSLKLSKDGASFLHKNSKLFLKSGSIFEGKLVFLRLKSGFQPMIKVFKKISTPRGLILGALNIYYYPSQLVSNSSKRGKDCPLGSHWDSSKKKCVGMFKHDYEPFSLVGGYSCGADKDPSFGCRGTGYGNYPNLANYTYPTTSATPSLPEYAYSYPQYSSADGDGKVELTQEEMDAIHNSTNTKKNFWSWLKSDQAKSLAQDSVGIAQALFNKNQEEKVFNENNQEESQTYNEHNGDDTPEMENKILGMHPLTFGLTALGFIVGAVVVTTMLRRGNK